MILTEFCFVKNGKDSTREIAKLVRKKDKVEILKRYAEAKQLGTFEIAPFDVMFLDGEFKGDLPYKGRHALLDDLLDNVPELYESWQDEVANAKAQDWEGFILRNDELGSQIHYTLNGKADKAGSFKYVFTHEDDFIVTGAVKGKAGKQTGLYAQFNLAQILSDGTMLDCGNCGPGKLKHDRLAELTQEIDSGQLNFPFTVQIEFRDQQPDSGKLTFPQLCEVRYDKKPEECTTDFIPEV
jgi:ATP-dependent DNA ligase